jgi:hypothetical protein
MLPYRDGGSQKEKLSFLLKNQQFPDYARRLLDWGQMDFEAAFDQMLTLLSVDPSRG